MADVFPDNENPVKLSVPGRICLFGEHSDWASDFGIHPGFCIVIGTDQEISATASKNARFIVESPIPDSFGRPTGRTRQMNCLWNSEALLDAAKDESEFFRYCAGVAYEVLNCYGNNIKGVDIRIKAMNLPLKKGVSSSAAVCILVAKAFDALYELKLLPYELMELAYLGERITGSQCGRMDQACIYGKTPVLLVFNKKKDVRVEPVFSENRIHMFFVDLAGNKDTLRILGDLHSEYLRNSQIQKALGQENERIVRQAYQSILKGDAEKLGELMSHAQEIFDMSIAPYSPEQLSSPLLHQVLNYDKIADHIYGGKGVGSQGDGTAQFVARSEDGRDKAMELIERAFPHMKCYSLTI